MTKKICNMLAALAERMAPVAAGTCRSNFKDYGDTPTNRKYFLWGCAMHMLGDTFAHSTKYRNAATGAIGLDIGHKTGVKGGADDPNEVPNRYQTAKMLVAYGMRCLRDGAIGDYYEFYQALKYAPHDGTWIKKHLLTYAESNSYGLSSGQRPYFEKASD